MTQNKISPRINFASINNKVEYPDFLDIQLKSFQSFFQTGTTLEERRNEGERERSSGAMKTKGRRKNGKHREKREQGRSLHTLTPDRPPLAENIVNECTKFFGMGSALRHDLD